MNFYPADASENTADKIRQSVFTASSPAFLLTLLKSILIFLPFEGSMNFLNHFQVQLPTTTNVV